MSETMVNRWQVFVGVDPSHCNVPQGPLVDSAKAAGTIYDSADLEYPLTCKRIVRMAFPRSPFAVASQVTVVRANHTAGA